VSLTSAGCDTLRASRGSQSRARMIGRRSDVSVGAFVNRRGSASSTWGLTSAAMLSELDQSLCDTTQNIDRGRTREELRSEFAMISRISGNFNPTVVRLSLWVGQILDSVEESLQSVADILQRDRVAGWLSSPCFTMVISLIILLNAAFTGYISHFTMEKTLAAYDEGKTLPFVEPSWHNLVESFFVVAFTLELLMRCFAEGCDFLFGKEWTWNAMDALLVAASFVELALPDAGVNLTFLRVERLFKMVRAFRILKVVRHVMLFRQLRILLLAVVNALVFMMWAILVLLVVIFLFSVLFMMGVVGYVNDAPSDDPTVAQFRIYFHSLPMAMLTLYMSCSGGVDWWEIAHLLLQMSWQWCLLFAFFQSVMLLGMLNIVTGFVVQDAVEALDSDKELQAHFRDERTAALCHELKALFHQMDSKGCGTVQKTEFVRFMKKEEARTLMAALEVNVTDADMLFNMLDVDENEEVEIDEFVMGAMSLKGHADALNMALLLHNNNRLIHRSFGNIHGLGKAIVALGHHMEDLFARDGCSRSPQSRNSWQALEAQQLEGGYAKWAATPGASRAN